jgi:hypothetical protein
MNEFAIEYDVTESCHQSTYDQLIDLNDLQLSLIGGGIADTIGH